MEWLVQSLLFCEQAVLLSTASSTAYSIKFTRRKKKKPTTKKEGKKTPKNRKPNFFSKRYWNSLQSIHRAEITHRLILYQNQTFLSYVSSACEVLLKLKSKELIFIERNEPWCCRGAGNSELPRSSRPPTPPWAPAGNAGEHRLLSLHLCSCIYLRCWAFWGGCRTCWMGEWISEGAAHAWIFVSPRPSSLPFHHLLYSAGKTVDFY